MFSCYIEYINFFKLPQITDITTSSFPQQFTLELGGTHEGFLHNRTGDSS